MAIFDEKIEIRVHCVDLGESFPTSIYLHKSASIQPRTSPSKFGGKFNSILIRLLGRGGLGAAARGRAGRGPPPRGALRRPAGGLAPGGRAEEEDEDEDGGFTKDTNEY